MRQFVGGLCCAIVGLEVLIGVPLVTCGVMFALWEGGDMSPVEFQVHAAAAPADLAGPFPCPPPPTIDFPQPVSFPVPSFPQPATCPPPATTADTCPPLSPAAEAIAEAHARNGSPLEGTILAENPGAPLAASEAFIAKVEQIATGDAVLPPSTETTVACRPLPVLTATAPIGPNSVADSLKQAAHSLYARASELEMAGDFVRSDKIRHLAREIHGQIECLGGESKPAAPEPSSAAASAIPAFDSADSNPTAPANPLVPAHAELVPATPLPTPTLTVPVTNIHVIPDDPSDLLIPQPVIEKPAEKPAPVAP